MPNSDPADALTGVIVEVIRYASAGEKINAAARACKLPLEILVTIDEQDKELRPELAAAADLLAQVVETLGRAHTFIEARLDTRLTTIAEDLGI